MNKYIVKTSALGGLLTLVAATIKLLADGDAATNPDWNTTVPLLISTVGLLFARQNNVTSEQVGAK